MEGGGEVASSTTKSRPQTPAMVSSQLTAKENAEYDASGGYQTPVRQARTDPDSNTHERPLSAM